MKRILFNLTAVAVMLGFAFNSQAQCPNDNGPNMDQQAQLLGQLEV